MIRDIHYVRMSGILGCIVVLLYLFPLRPSYVVPVTRIYKTKKLSLTVLRVSSIFLCLLLPLNIGRESGKHIETSKNYTIQIIVDVSLSMAGTDIQPSRFHAAKASIITLINSLPGYNISLITFSGKPLIYIPFTNNAGAAIQKLEQTTLADFSPTDDFKGTAIGDALLLGIQNIEQNTEKDETGILLLLTDGDSNVGAPPSFASDTAKRLGIPIFTLGIGEDNLTLGEGYFGEKVVAKINIPLLQELSDDTGGTFYRVYEPKDFLDIFDAISNSVKAYEKKHIVFDYTYINVYVLLLLCLLLLTYIFISFSKYTIAKK